MKAPITRSGWHYISMQTFFSCWRLGLRQKNDKGSPGPTGQLLPAPGHTSDIREVGPNSETGFQDPDVVQRPGYRGSRKTEMKTERGGAVL